MLRPKTISVWDNHAHLISSIYANGLCDANRDEHWQTKKKTTNLESLNVTSMLDDFMGNWSFRMIALTLWIMDICIDGAILNVSYHIDCLTMK